MESHIINTLKEFERVTSTYAEIYFDENHCDYKELPVLNYNHKRKHSKNSVEGSNGGKKRDEWVSPSDTLIGVVDLQPPLTSKTVKSKTHQGILKIGDEVLQAEKQNFLDNLTKLLRYNDDAWRFVLDFEKEQAVKSVKAKYECIFIDKVNIMSKEMMEYYENSLKELENCVRNELQGLLLTAHANIVSNANIKIKEQIAHEHNKLDNILNERYQSEVQKLELYYNLLLDNEYNRCNKVIKNLIIDRNDAVKAFYRQLEAETLTSTMYVMSAERKKCQIRKIALENYQTSELHDIVKVIKEKQDVLNALKENKTSLMTYNEQLEKKIENILHIFFKFINYTLKLLPEQSAFLTDFKTLLILQLNEIQKAPLTTLNILQDEEDIQNVFKFEKIIPSGQECDKDPLIIEGDLTDPIVPVYGSRETLPSEVSLPIIRVQRQFIYAQCHKFEEVKAFLESQRCKCHDQQPQPQSQESMQSDFSEKEPLPFPAESSDSVFESLLVEDFHRFTNCPARGCKNWAGVHSFPDLNSYLDFSEENFERVKVILSKPAHSETVLPDLDEAFISDSALPFTATRELYRNVATQYTSPENFNQINCTCIDEVIHSQSHYRIQDSTNKTLDDILLKRKRSVVKLLNNCPELLKIFTDEDSELHV